MVQNLELAVCAYNKLCSSSTVCGSKNIGCLSMNEVIFFLKISRRGNPQQTFLQMVSAIWHQRQNYFSLL